MRTSEWDNMGVKIDGRLIHHLCFADDIVFITRNIIQAERMIADFDKARGKIGLRLNPAKTMFMSNGLVWHATFTLNGTNNMLNDLAAELSRRKRTDWRAFNSIEDVVKRAKNDRLRAHLFVSTVLPALTYSSET
ncbi:unnamed protein product [Angiostrongylus costaricensis]|uniref:Reverse transcriptase domain-containing protein n=1 Tax=Angiostrongylus costaricensis TaxID=334426 RepID=A0A0R3PMP3_ANGCS|nr:unnamed protein product [Angiostrongylus costaricensis]